MAVRRAAQHIGSDSTSGAVRCHPLPVPAAIHREWIVASLV